MPKMGPIKRSFACSAIILLGLAGCSSDEEPESDRAASVNEPAGDDMGVADDGSAPVSGGDVEDPDTPVSDVDGDSEDLAEPAAPAEGSSDGDNYYHGYSKEEVAEELEASYAALNARV